MKIVHITTVPQSLVFLTGQIGFMSARGFDLHVISSPGSKLEAFESRERVKAYPLEMPRRITPLRDVQTVQKLVGILRQTKPELVHAHTPKGGLLGMISAWLARTPVRIYHMRGLPYMTATGFKRTLLIATERVSCRLAHRVFCVSHSLRDVAIHDGICPPDKIVVFGGGSGNGVDAADRFNPERFNSDHRRRGRARLGIPSDARVIGFVGRVVRDKGVHELALAWQALRERCPDSHLVLVGRVEPKDPVDPEVMAKLVKDPRVHLLGEIGDTSEIYPLFDLVVLPTYREGFPNVPLEAAALELPVVATDIPGCVDAVQHEVTGTLVPPRDAGALSKVTGRYLDDPALRRRHGKAGRERVLREFRQEGIWDEIHQEYVRLLQEKGIRVRATTETVSL